MIEEPKKIVTTWGDLEVECEKLGEFYSQAQDCLDDIMAAVSARSEILLREALFRWGHLKALPTFSVSPDLYSGPGATLRLVN